MPQMTIRRMRNIVICDLSSRVKNPFLSLEDGTDRFPETSVRNNHYLLRNSPEERSANPHRSGSLKSRRARFMTLAFAGVISDLPFISFCSHIYIAVFFLLSVLLFTVDVATIKFGLFVIS